VLPESVLTNLTLYFPLHVGDIFYNLLGIIRVSEFPYTLCLGVRLFAVVASFFPSSSAHLLIGLVGVVIQLFLVITDNGSFAICIVMVTRLFGAVLIGVAGKGF
jgi:hypothetical protein